MKTTVDIPDKMLKELVDNAKTKVKKDAILGAIEEYNQKHRLQKLVKHLGTFEDLISSEDLLKLRKVVK